MTQTQVNKRPKYNVGELVYSYQNKTIPYPVFKLEFRAWDSNLGQHINDTFAYKISLPNGLSKWIDEKSVSLTPLK